MTYCNQNIISDNLLFNFDLATTKSYNSGNTIVSLNKWNQAISSNEIITDFGLTQYDVGQVNSLTSSTYFNTSNTFYTLKNIGYNDASGNTYYNQYPVTPLYDYTGMYVELSGGYYQNFFKLYDFNYEILPYRFNNGFTFETWLNISPNTFSNIVDNNGGIFLYLGMRAENKFTTLYSGNTATTTSSGSTLGPDNIINLEDGVNNNVLAFKFNDDSSISVRKIDGSAYLIDENLNTPVSNTGWTMVTITWTPYELIDDFYTLMDCAPDRSGDLSIYINGLLYSKLGDFNEFWFKPMNTSGDKQIGIPYNISWGGGSFGLEHSWNFSSTGSTNYPYYEKNPLSTGLLIENNFNGSFYGGIQKFRMYNNALDFTEVRYNFLADNSRYLLPNNFGGRIIYY
jgi:hypothetical protein